MDKTTSIIQQFWHIPCKFGGKPSNLNKMKTSMLWMAIAALSSLTGLFAQSSWNIQVKGDVVTFDGEHVMNVMAAKGGDFFVVTNVNKDTLLTVKMRQFINPELLNDPKNPRGIIRFFEYQFVPMKRAAETQAPEVYNRKTVIMDLSGNDLIWPGGLDSANVRVFSDRFGTTYTDMRNVLMRRYGRKACTVPGTE